MPDGKTRAASEGPWIASADVSAFLQFCDHHGHSWKDHPDPWRVGYLIKHKGQWMGLLWNKSFQRYTADRRLALIVQSFAVEKAAG